MIAPVCVCRCAGVCMEVGGGRSMGIVLETCTGTKNSLSYLPIYRLTRIKGKDWES